MLEQHKDASWSPALFFLLTRQGDLQSLLLSCFLKIQWLWASFPTIMSLLHTLSRWRNRQFVARPTASPWMSTKEMVVNFRKRQQQCYNWIMFSSTPLKIWVTSGTLDCKFLLTWPGLIISNTICKNADWLLHLRSLRKFRISPVILKTFYTGTRKNLLTLFISMWHENCSIEDWN